MRRLPDITVPEFAAMAAAGPDDYDLGALLPAERAVLHPQTLALRRRHFVLGRLAARRALAELGVPAAPILRGPHREPLWPDGIVGSITHAQGRAAAVVASSEDCAGIGLDMEHRSRFFDDLVDKIAFDDELAWIGPRGAAQRPTRALEVFSAKESIYKAFFPRVGRYFGFGAARLAPIDDPPGFSGRLIEPLDAEYPRERSFFIQRAWHDDVVLTGLFLFAEE